MENREKKTLTGFCYWGGERKVNANGTFLYNGGMCVAVLLEERSQVNELREKVCGALNINFEGKMFFYNTKRDKTKYVTLNDDNGVAMLFHLNEDDVDLFVEDTRQNNDPICNTTYNSTRESMVTDNISSPGGIVALPSSSQINKEVELPLAKQMQSCNEKRDCGIRDSGNETYLSESRRLQLQFMDKLSHPVLTRRAIKGEKNTSIGIALYDVLTGQVVNTGPEASTKVEIVVLEKDFNGHDWSLEEFNSKIVWKQGGGKTLLIGDVYVKLKKGIGSIGNIHFKHTKRWMKKIEFRLGARTVDVALGHRVREAKTDSFTVEDRRGKLYQKNHPPSLSDAVWRLENIGKDGAFHDRLSKENINTVKDFMTLFYMDCPRLQQILGRGMSTAMWKVTVNHAQTYIPVPRLYFYCPGSQQETGVVFSVVGQVMGLLSECQYTRLDKLSETEKGDAHDMVIAAFKNWEKVVSFDDEASLINASAHFFSNVLHANSADIKVLTSQEVGGFDCPQVSVCSPDNNPSIYSMGGVNRWDDFNFLDIDHLDPIYNGTWNFDGQVANSLGAGCSFQSGKSDLQSVVDRFSVAFAQRRWTMLFSVLKWFSIRKDSARKTHVRRKQRLC